MIPPVDTGDTGLIPRWERSPGEGNGYPLQYSCLENPMDKKKKKKKENPMDRGAWRATVHGVLNSRTQRSD